MLVGLTPSVNIVFDVIADIPAAIFFIALGLFLGAVLSTKQVGGVCGTLITNLTAWLSGAWFELSLVGGVFEAIANILPFAHSVELGRELLAGNAAAALPHIIWCAAYAVVFAVLAVLVFFKKMKRL